ncbi:hypothetical protein DPMN_145802 [Dreissena polymorpha]|uniref:Uncharacterized protein n=1 Tax=Dreissena polymorpha TaxID=45954 RepID=A0A9D4F5K7_DREPO|nr:hypothetical protein DPMN_145802 [Dreissena polymorpha]
MWLPEVEDRAKWAMFRHLGEKNCFNLQATTIIKGFIQIYTYKDFQPDDPLNTGAWKLEENALKPAWMREPKAALQHDDACLNAHTDRQTDRQASRQTET